jgi:hypothetical protein
MLQVTGTPMRKACLVAVQLNSGVTFLKISEKGQVEDTAKMLFIKCAVTGYVIR